MAHLLIQPVRTLLSFTRQGRLEQSYPRFTTPQFIPITQLGLVPRLQRGRTGQ